MNSLTQKDNTLKNIAITLFFTILPLQILMFLNKDNKKPYYESIIYIIVILLAILVIKRIGKPKNLTTRLKNMNMVFKGWYLLIASMILAILNFLSIDFSNTISTLQVISFFMNTMLGVIFEELVFRGIIQNMIVEKYEVCKKSVWKGIVTSSFIFALMHLLNLIGQPYFILGTVTQVIYTFCLGIMLGVVYFFSKNIWTVILLHFIFNIFGSYSSLFSTDVSNSDIPFIGAMIQIVIMLPCIYIAFVTYRKNN
ncbi:MAG TPA: CPBP family intramembrane metalloprotease [Candidatus Blautia stercoravium]|nr:CPBP family intramembrane metalloprotease [Candidatus Blautia stercoravium]